MTRDELIQSAMPQATRWIHWAVPNWRRRHYADDLLQDAYMAITEAADRYIPERGEWYSYACIAVRNACLDRVRWERGAVHVPRYIYIRALGNSSERDWLLGLETSLDGPVGEDGTMHEMVSDGRIADWEDEVCEALDCERIIEAAKLAEREREVWRLRYDDECPAFEVVAKLGIATKSQDNAWQRAKRKVREAYRLAKEVTA